MQVILETAKKNKLYYHNGKFYTSHYKEISQALKEDASELPEIVLPIIEELKATGGFHHLAQYVWLSYESETGSVDSKLVMNGNYPLDELIPELKAIPAKKLIQQCPKWISNLKEIRITAQNIFMNGKVMYRRTINIHKP